MLWTRQNVISANTQCHISFSLFHPIVLFFLFKSSAILHLKELIYQKNIKIKFSLNESERGTCSQQLATMLTDAFLSSQYRSMHLLFFF